MVKVTDKNYYIDSLLKSKLDLMIKRLDHNFDNVLIIDGEEGMGKSTIGKAIGYYVGYETKRGFSVEDIFFPAEELIKRAKKEKEKVYLWDEAALGGLGSDWFNKWQQKLLKLFMIARKKKHFYILCIPNFTRLNRYFANERAKGLVHVYSKDGIQRGRFCYLKERMMEKFWWEAKKTRMRPYARYVSKGWASLGRFTDTSKNNLIDEKAYEEKKDKAIVEFDRLTIGRQEKKFLLERYNIVSNLKDKGLSLRAIAKIFNRAADTIKNITEYPKKYPELFRK